MTKHICKYCDFKTDKTSTYNDHLKSKKHLKAIQSDDASVSSMSSKSSKSTTSLYDAVINETDKQILELKHQLELKEIEILNITKEYTLKLQMKDIELKHKDELIKNKE